MTNIKDCEFYQLTNKKQELCILSVYQDSQKVGCKSNPNCLYKQLLASKQENETVKCEQCQQGKHIQRCHAWLVGKDGKPLKYICLDCLMENAGVNKILLENKKMREALENVKDAVSECNSFKEVCSEGCSMFTGHGESDCLIDGFILDTCKQALNQAEEK